MTDGIGTVSEIASLIGAELLGPGDAALCCVETLEDAEAGALSFARDERHLLKWPSSKASAIIVSKELHENTSDGSLDDGRPVLLVTDADLALIRLLEALDQTPEVADGVHQLAYVDPSARVEAGASVGPYAQVGENSEIGAGTRVHAGAVIGKDVRIGAGCTIRENVVLYDRTVVGDGSTLHAGVVLGADGFGYRPSEDGRSLVKVPHIGRVEIGRDVEIGANTTIDRGKFGATKVGDGTKIDNLVMIGHNCRIGRGCIICGTVGISGSVTIGDGVTIGGGAGIADNLTIGDGVRVGAQSGVLGDIAPGSTVLGAPARDSRRFLRNSVAFDRLDETLKKIKPLLKDAT